MLDSLTILAYLFARPHGSVAPEIFKINSQAFKDHHTIPVAYTCYGAGAALPLSWKGVPQKTKSIAILMMDTDMPRQASFYHWAIFNLPPDKQSLANAQQTHAAMKFSKNSWGESEYRPPCPKHGIHHYRIQAYALDKKLPSGADKSPVIMRKKMRHHIIASAKITGLVRAPHHVASGALGDD